MTVDNNYPLVTVIASCYNQERFVIEALDSIRDQTYPNIQLILWDDCSTDNSVKTIDDWITKNQINCFFIRHSVNQGICKSLNEAFSYAKGKYLQLIALDDILLPDKVERHVDMLEKTNDDVVLVFSDAYLISAESTLYQNRFIAYHKRYLSFKSGNFFEELINGNFIPAMSILMKTELVRHIGKWDEKLSYEDYDMLLRLAKKYEFLYEEIPTVKYRLHDSNLHKNIPDLAKSDFQIYLKHLDNDQMKLFCINKLKSLYITKNKELRFFSDLYFDKMDPTDFMQRCIRAHYPYLYYKIVRWIKSTIKRCIKY